MLGSCQCNTHGRHAFRLPPCTRLSMIASRGPVSLHRVRLLKLPLGINYEVTISLHSPLSEDSRERPQLSWSRENNGAGAAGGAAAGGPGLDDEEEAFLRWAAENPDAEELRFPEDGAAAQGATAQLLEPGILRARTLNPIGKIP